MAQCTLEPAGRAPKPAGRASEPSGRTQGVRRKNKEKTKTEKIPLYGGTVGHCTLRGSCPQGEQEGDKEGEEKEEEE